MSATETKTKWEELAELDAELELADKRVEAIRVEEREVSRRVDKALAPIREYHERVGAGEVEFDAEHAAKLEAELSKVREGLTFSIQGMARGDGKQLVATDPRIEAQLAGALRTQEAARTARDRFLSANVQALGRELMPSTEAARDELAAAWSSLRDGERAWLSALQKWARLIEPIGLTRADLPPHPLHGLTVNLDAGVPLPMPAAVSPEGSPKR